MKMGLGLISPSNWMGEPLPNLRNIFAQQWNYQYGKRYGSPELFR
ncbi:MAG: hypothetical protein ACJZ7A_07580 [Opitutales bacterium]